MNLSTRIHRLESATAVRRMSFADCLETHRLADAIQTADLDGIVAMFEDPQDLEEYRTVEGCMELPPGYDWPSLFEWNAATERILTAAAGPGAADPDPAEIPDPPSFPTSSVKFAQTLLESPDRYRRFFAASLLFIGQNARAARAFINQRGAKVWH